MTVEVPNHMLPIQGQSVRGSAPGAIRGVKVYQDVFDPIVRDRSAAAAKAFAAWSPA